MTTELNDEPIDVESLAEAYADLKERCEELEAIVDRHARTVARYGLDFTDTGYLGIVDRFRALAYLGKEAVKRLEEAAVKRLEKED